MATGSPDATTSVTMSVKALRNESADFLSDSVRSAIAVTKSLRFTETPSRNGLGCDGQPCTTGRENGGFCGGFRVISLAACQLLSGSVAAVVRGVSTDRFVT